MDEILKSAPKSGTARLNKRSLERLDNLVRQGFWITAVNGYASPEGRRRPPDAGDQGPAAKWEGNKLLSEARAKKVLKLMNARYVMTTTLAHYDLPPRMRFPNGVEMPTGVGQSEKPILDDNVGREIEGAALDRILINGKPGDEKSRVLPFLTSNPDELRHMTIEDRKFVSDSNQTVRDRAERLFENLRRVEIHLRKDEPFHPATDKAPRFEHVHPCPDDLIEAAERAWGSRTPVIKPDPPLCG